MLFAYKGDLTGIGSRSLSNMDELTLLYNCTYVHSGFCYLMGIEALACTSISALLCFRVRKLLLAIALLKLHVSQLLLFAYSVRAYVACWFVAYLLNVMSFWCTSFENEWSQYTRRFECARCTASEVWSRSFSFYLCEMQKAVAPLGFCWRGKFLFVGLFALLSVLHCK